MTADGVKIEMRRSYMRYRKGQVVVVTPGLARTLELSGYAKRVADAPQLEFATVPVADGAERAESPVAKQRRRKHA